MNERSTSHEDASQALVARFAEWAAERDDIRAMFIVGSRARTDRPADRWSDLDLVFLTTDPEPYLDDGGWLGGFGPVLLTFVEETLVPGIRERRVLFEDGRDVDLVPIPVGSLPDMRAAAGDVIRRGMRVLVDKDGEVDALLTAAAGQRPEPTAEDGPSADSYNGLVDDVLYHLLWTARKIARGELWTARSCLEGYLRWRLLAMVEWHARVVRGVQDTWFEGRFLETWADPRMLAGLADASSRYDRADLVRALHAAAALTRQLGREVGSAMGYEYPEARHERLMALVGACLEEG